MSKKLFPQRQRCENCRKKLESTVINGVHCSYSCAGLPAPADSPTKAPRSCKRMVNGTWDFKKRYRCEEDVPQKLQDDPGTNIYRCEYCYHLHVGHSRPDPVTRDKLRRKIGDPQTYGTVLKRLREDKGFTLKQMATRLQVPQIRIKEIETGSPDARLDITISLTYALGCNLNIQER